MPSICDLKTNRIYNLTRGQTFVVGRCIDANLPVRDPHCSRQQFLIHVDADEHCTLEPRSKHTPTFCDGKVAETMVLLDRDMEILAGDSRFRFSLADVDSLSLGIRSRLAIKNMATVAGSLTDWEHVEFIAPILIESQCVIGRDPGMAQVLLPHVQVSRTHARIVPHRDGAILTDLGSTGGTFVNGRRLSRPTRIHDGDVIGIGPYQLTYDNNFLIGETQRNDLQLVGRGLCKFVQDREGGTPKRILNDVSLVIRPMEFVCIIGPAGCGKSTLLAALCARVPADSGSVFLNQADLYLRYEQLKRTLALVPQRDLLHPELTVEQSLRYTARLRLPSDTRAEEIDSVVRSTIEKVGLVKQHATKIGVLSGGQTKRASLATELLSHPSVVFLDEVTSGLDQQSDRDAMILFRRLAEEGKTLICVTHNLVNLEDTCHLLVVLAEGGRLAFVGPPAEAIKHFDVQKIGDVYFKLSQHDSDHWSRRFLESKSFADYVGSRLATSARSESSSETTSTSASRRTMQTFIKQTPVLLSRYCRLQYSDQQALLATIGQCVLVAFLLTLVYGKVNDTGQTDPAIHLQTHANYASSLFLMTVVSCFWFGCNNASKELVKERAIFLKESHSGLSIGAYYVSKVLPLSFWSVLQSILLFAVVSHFCELQSEFVLGIGIVSTIAIVGVTLGLAISAVSKTETLATALVPIALIPQMILSSGLRPLDGLPKMIGSLFISSYWGFGAILSTLTDTLTPYLATQPGNRAMAFTVLLLHAMIQVAIAVFALRASTTSRER